MITQKEIDSLSESQLEYLLDMVYKAQKKFIPKDHSIKYISSISPGISVRLYNALRAADIQYIDELANFTRDMLPRFRNFGNKSMAELDIIMERFNIKYKGE